MCTVYNTVKWCLRIVHLWPDSTSSKMFNSLVFLCFFLSMRSTKCVPRETLPTHNKDSKTSAKCTSDDVTLHWLSGLFFLFLFFSTREDPPSRSRALQQGPDCLYPFQPAKHDLHHVKVCFQVEKSKGGVAQFVLKRKKKEILRFKIFPFKQLNPNIPF